MLHVALKASIRRRCRFSLLHVDTTWNFVEMIAFRYPRRRGSVSICASTSTRRAGARHITVASGSQVHTQVMKTSLCDRPSRRQVRRGVRAARGVTRRRARKEASSRTARPPMHGTRATSARNSGSSYNTRIREGESMRVFPCRTGPNSTSGNTSAPRKFLSCALLRQGATRVERGGTLIMVDDERLPLLREAAAHAARPLPHPRLLSSHGRDRIGRRHARRDHR